ncbi:MAG: NADP-specific glutamate dehydrogenase, partial [Francisella endosymbiont of Hyalomma scupense]
MNAQEYIDSVIAQVEKRDGHEKEFIQAVKELFSTLKPTLEQNPKYIEENILARIV